MIDNHLKKARRKQLRSFGQLIPSNVQNVQTMPVHYKNSHGGYLKNIAYSITYRTFYQLYSVIGGSTVCKVPRRLEDIGTT
jgi:hypothetical protein